MKSEMSRIVLGTDWMIAVPNLASWNIAPTKRADAILNGAVEMGINSFDTARMYWSEGVVGRFVGNIRWVAALFGSSRRADTRAFSGERR